MCTLAWQAQRFVKLHVQISWRAQHFVNMGDRETMTVASLLSKLFIHSAVVEEICSFEAWRVLLDLPRVLSSSRALVAVDAVVFQGKICRPRSALCEPWLAVVSADSGSVSTSTDSPAGGPVTL